METYIYIIASENKNPIKIGFSVHPEKRLRQLQTASADKLVLYHAEAFPTKKIKYIERIIHKNLKHKRLTGEWFQMNVDDGVLEVKYAVIRYLEEDNLTNFL